MRQIINLETNKWDHDLNKKYGNIDHGLLLLKYENISSLVRIGTTDSFIFYELYKRNAYRHITISPTDRWLDIGGHIGLFSLMCPFAVAVEPDVDNYNMIRENVNLNGRHDIVTINKAVVGGSQDKVILYTTPLRMKDSHSICPIKGRSQLEVEAVNINKLLYKYNINKIKLDCEGAEFDIIKHADLSNIEEMIIEVHFSVSRKEDNIPYFELIEKLKANFNHVDYPEARNDNRARLVHARS